MTLVSERFRRLLEELGAELGHGRGWRTRVAEQLGLSPAHLTKILKGQRGVSVDSAKRAADALGFDMSYFVSGDRSDSVSYRDYLSAGAPNSAKAADEPPAARHQAQRLRQAVDDARDERDAARNELDRAEEAYKDALDALEAFAGRGRR